MTESILSLKSSWETLKESDEPIILYGTGNGADKIIDELERLGISLAGVTASDGFVRERFFRGFKVFPLSYFEEKYASFTVIIGFGTNRDEVIDNILRIKNKHRVLVPCVPVYGDEIINRDFLINHCEELKKAYSCLEDEKSEEVFVSFLKFELTGELEYLFESETEKDEAFFKILQLNEAESYLDLGAYRGDTVREFLKYTNGKYRHITAVEPDKKSFEKLECNISSLNDITLLNAGVFSECAYASFDTEAKGRGNSISERGERQKVINVDSLKESGFTYIKADIEGSEAEMLDGARLTLGEDKPKLNIACYHKSCDIFRLILKIKEINPDYRIYLRHHHYIPCWDLNLYCV